MKQYKRFMVFECSLNSKGRIWRFDGDFDTLPKAKKFIKETAFKDEKYKIFDRIQGREVSL